MGRNNSHDAYENDAKMSVSIAPSLGVNWMTNLLAGDLGGPVIANNPSLGKTLAYVGNERGDLSALNEATGQAVWSTSVGVGDAIYSTPLVSSDESSVWVGTAFNAAFWKLDAATGAVDCSQKTQLAVQMSATEGNPSGNQSLVFIGQIDTGGVGGPLLAFAESQHCKVVWSSNPYKVPFTGSWVSAAYGVDKNGRALVFEGTADPDSSEYAMDASTGKLVWYFPTQTLGDGDIGAAATVSPPGKNGFADGVLYLIDKQQIIYALNLTTGALIWSYNFGPESGSPTGNSRSSAALEGNTLVFGMANGVYAVNAVTGAKRWHYTDPASVEVISSPAIVGPPGKEVVAFGDLAGQFHVLNLASGAQLYQYQTGNYITGSPSYVNGHFLIASMDGFLYDFAAGGGNSTPPATGITFPSQGATVPYASKVTISGTATDVAGVRAVEVAVQSGGGAGQWYNNTTKTWGSGALTNIVPVAIPAKSTTWSFAIPVPTSGAAFEVIANAVNIEHQADLKGQKVSFAVSFSPQSPQLQTTAVFIAPGDQFGVTGSGFGPKQTVVFSIGPTVFGQTTSGSDGKLSATLTLPTASQFGLSSLTATDDQSHQQTVAAIDVANRWLQSADTPAHTAYELNDQVFYNVISPGNNDFLSRAWYYMSSAAVESSPSEYEAITYFGNDTGTLAAVQNDTAAPVWSLTIPSDAAIRSAPAIDPTTGDVVFTADDGVVYVATAGTGTLVGQATVGGLPTSATVHNGTIYVGSNNNTLTSLSEQTGTVNWSATLAGAVIGAPALDTNTKVLVVGDDSGAISAYNSGSGTRIWKVNTRGAVTASPTIVNGIVYVGSADGKVYALRETTGSARWTFSAGTPITTNAPYDPDRQELLVGGQNGSLYGLKVNTGLAAWVSAPKNLPLSPYVGISAVNGEVFANIASGSLVSFRSSQFGRWNSNHTTAGPLTTAPAVNDGTVYVGASDGGVYAFTTTGALPQSVSPLIRRAAAARDAQQTHPIWHSVQKLYQRFSWTGQRDFALHVDTIRRTTAGAAPGPLVYHGGPVVTAPHRYTVFWKPAGLQVEKGYVPAVLATLKANTQATGGGVAGEYLDTTAYPLQMSDAALQAELSRAIAINHWQPGIDAQFYILTANGALPPNAGFCSYHSAFALGHDRGKIVVYGVAPYSGAVGACTPAAKAIFTGEPAIDAVTMNLTRLEHQLSSDPLLNGWHDSAGGELGRGF